VLVSSRYANAGFYTIKRYDGVTIGVYGRRDALDSQYNSPYTITATTRLDLLAFDAYQDETLYWAISDQSPEIDPFNVAVNPGSTVVIPNRTEIIEFVDGD
jgi:hypothetical protein